MERRTALVPDAWEDPRDTSLQRIGDNTPPPAGTMAG